MYIITLAPEHAAQIEAVRAYADRERLENPNLNGAEIEVEAGDFASVDGPNERFGARLLGRRAQHRRRDVSRASAQQNAPRRANVRGTRYESPEATLAQLRAEEGES